MIDLFKELIGEFHKSHIPRPSKRDIVAPSVLDHVRKALIFIGMRRSGKTWALYQIMHDLIAQGIDQTKMLYINFEDERLSGMQVQHFQDILKAYFQLYPSYNAREDIHFFFDEIHEIEGWEKFIRRLLDQGRMKIYITGSSSKMLSKEIATTLRGRTYPQEIFPFSFSEYLRKKNIPVPDLLASQTRNAIIHNVRQYLQFGGFPEVIESSPADLRIILQQYTDAVMYRDIVDRYGVRSTHVLRYLLTHCLRNSATAFSINKIYNQLKSIGYETSKVPLYDYMDYFEDAYCVFSVSKYDHSLLRSSQSIKKVYAVDQGLITSVTLDSNFDLATQLETAVFMHLRRQTNTIYYYRSLSGQEVDFVCTYPEGSIQLYQASLTMTQPTTRKREIKGLEMAMHALKVNTGVIVTLDEEDTISSEAGTINVIPVWKFLLGLS